MKHPYIESYNNFKKETHPSPVKQLNIENSKKAIQLEYAENNQRPTMIHRIEFSDRGRENIGLAKELLEENLRLNL